MALKLKSKVALGGFFLFALLLTVGIMSIYYFNLIATETKGVIKNNYETLIYSQEMLKEIDDHDNKTDSLFLNHFDKNLRSQEKNITEPGEKELTLSLRSHFELLKQYPDNDSVKKMMRSDINKIMHLNLYAIEKKSFAAEKLSEKAKTIITIMLTLCVIVGFSFLYNFPSLVASPVAKLTEGITAIAGKKYDQRIHLNRNDEFGELANAFNLMAEKLNDYEHSNLAKILFEKQRAETVINSLKDASIGIDNKGVVLFANRQALQFLNLNEKDVVGIKQDEVSKRNDLFRFLSSDENNLPFKIVVNGKENYFIKEIIDLKDNQENTGTVIVLKNITPFKELDVAKTNFIATISHELKTPLASSDFSLRLLENEKTGALTSEQKELVKSLKNDNKRLLRILSELLDFSQVEAGKIKLNLQSIQPSLIVEKALESVKNVAKEKNISIQTEIPGDLPLTIADLDKTAWVLNNLLINAIHYSPANSIIHLGVKQFEKDIQFSVQDFGKGIEPRYKEKIFDKYFRVPGTKDGTGLGLSICKELIESQNGQINAVSEFGKGSIFTFKLPLA